MAQAHVKTGLRRVLGLLVSSVLALGLAGAVCATLDAQPAFAEEAAGCPGEDHNPGFTVTSTDGTKTFAASHTANGYTYYDWNLSADVAVCLYTVKVPEGTKTVTITAEKDSLFYNYQNGEYLDGWVDDSTVGSATVTVPVDSNNDGTLDHVQVQDPYVEENGVWSGGTLRYALAFQEVSQAEPAVDVDQLIGGLNARFSKGGADATINNATWAAALALNALGQSGSLDAEAIATDLADLDPYTLSAGQLGKYVLILTAANVDCTKASLGDQEVDLIQLLKDKVKSVVDGGKAIDEWSAPCVAPVFGCCGYDATGFETYIQGMINTMVAKVPSLYEGWGSIDIMSAGQAILALQPYAEQNEEVATALETAKIELLRQLKDDGSFPTQWGNGVDDTALAYAALKALGVSDQEMYTVGGSNPVTYLASRAKGSLDGFDVEGNETLSASSALLGLAASKVEGNVYQAKKPVEPSDPEPGPVVDPEPKPAPVSLKSVTVYSATKTYNGTSQTIKVAVKGKDGKTLVKNRDYTMSRSSVKSVGTYAVKITGKGGYKGSITKYVKVNPAKEGMYYVKAGKKRALVRATKSAAKCGATKIQFAYKKVGATKWHYKTSSSSKTYLTKLSKGKKYYVKARAIKTVNGKTYYGAWSSCKKTSRIK